MRDARWLLAPLVLCPALVPAFACTQGPDVAAVALVMKAPAGILDDATSVKLSVADAASAPCLPTGHVELGDAQAQSFDLQRTGCAADAAWCKDIELDKDGTKKTFAIVASSAAGILGEGCTTATIDQDPIEVAVKILRYNPPACCGDADLQAGEQCECGVGITTCSGGSTCSSITADAVCEASCVAKEIAIDGGGTTAGSTKQLSLAFCPGDSAIANGLRAAYTDATSAAIGGSDIGVRVLSDKLYPLAAGNPLEDTTYLPLLCSNIGAKGGLRQQITPSIAPISSELTAIVYATDEFTGAKFDIYLSPQSKIGCRDKQGSDPDAVQLNTSGTSASDPDVAGGPSGSALAVWTENNAVHGRIFTAATGSSPPWSLVPAASDIVIATSGSGARVGGSANGWVVVYQGAGSGDGDGIFAKFVDGSGVVSAEKQVNAAIVGLQDQPDIAALSDGRTGVVWRSGGDVFFQRFDAVGKPVAGDQDGPLHVAVEGEQAHPAIAAYGALYAAAWENADAATIGARFLGADGGFLYNSVNGQNTEFEATQPGIVGQRRAPAVAVGGAGFVAIGWQDESAAHAGVFVRRFPLPAQ